MSRKDELVHTAPIAAGGIWILALLIGVIRFDPTVTIGAIVAVIGGVVDHGQLKAAETQQSRVDRHDQSSGGWSEWT